MFDMFLVTFLHLELIVKILLDIIRGHQCLELSLAHGMIVLTAKAPIH